MVSILIQIGPASVLKNDVLVQKFLFSNKNYKIFFIKLLNNIKIIFEKKINILSK